MQTPRFLYGLAAPLALALPSLAAAPANSGGGTLDYSYNNMLVVQTLPNVTFSGDKSTCVRVRVNVNGTVPPGTVIDAQLRVFVNGVEEPYSPVYSQNGPLAPPETGYTLQNFDHTINFFFVPPASNDVEFEVEINPPGPGQVCETDYTNNTGSSGSLVFECKDKPRCVYVPIDYRPGGGGTPNLPNAQLIKPGVGDNFLHGIFPSGDWDYHRSVAASKLWTQSLNFTGSGLLNSLHADLLAMVPQPDFIYGWVPGGLPYNGQANGIPGRAGMGNTQTFKFQRTFAHELGHLFGRVHISNTVGRIGIDVEHQLNETEGLSPVKLGTLNDIMVPGLNSNQAWVYPINYEFFSNHFRFACSGLQRAQAPGGKALMFGGLWNRKTNEVELTDSVAFGAGEPSMTVPLDQATLIMRAWSGGEVAGEFGYLVNPSTDSCADEPHEGETDSAEGTASPLAGFMVLLPDTLDPDAVERMDVVLAESGQVLASMEQSSSAPTVQIITPSEGSQLSGNVLLSWDASDVDGDDLSFYVRYSPDGNRMEPLATNLKASELEVDFAALPALEPGGFFEINATDGLNTTTVRTNGVSSRSNSRENRPGVFVATPDEGKSYPVGATVILHGTGWDIEDGGLEGADLVWTSDLDGVIGQGRLDQTASLSVGAHVITVTGTDSDGRTSSDSKNITITARDLPAELCQENIGFGGPGSSLLQVCGGDLSTGTSAEIELLNAAPNAFLFLLYSDQNNPVGALGGTLVPIPYLGFEIGTTDADGYWNFTLPGGGGPVTYYGQAVYVDPVTTWGISNAVKVDILP